MVKTAGVKTDKQTQAEHSFRLNENTFVDSIKQGAQPDKCYL